MYWIVFSRIRNENAGQSYGQYPGGAPQFFGPIRPTFSMSIVPAIFRCDTAEQACQAAAKKIGGMGTYFAVEGTPWGVDLLDVEGVSELGDDELTDDKERRIRELERTVLDRDDLPQ